MHDANHYRDQAERARWLARNVGDPEMRKTLEDLARDFDELAEDLELGAIEIRHAELLPQRRK